MDFSYNEEQRGWQLEARKFAMDEIRPMSLARDQIEGGFEPWNWDIIEKGSKLGFRTLAVPKEWGGPGADFVSQALVMAMYDPNEKPAAHSSSPGCAAAM